MADFAEVAAVGCYVGLCGVRWDKQDRGGLTKRKPLDAMGHAQQLPSTLFQHYPTFIEKV